MSAWRIQRPDTAFAETNGQRKERQTDDRHLRFIRGLPCCICLARGAIDAAHVRMRAPERGKGTTGGSRKPDDKWAVPLCDDHHTRGRNAQHRSGERVWWARQGIDPIALAEALYAVTGDTEAGFKIVNNARSL